MPTPPSRRSSIWRRERSASRDRVLDAPVADAALEQLAAVLVDCVEGGASVSFMAPFSHSRGARVLSQSRGLGRLGRYRAAGGKARRQDRRHGAARTGYAAQPAAPRRHQENAGASLRARPRHRRGLDGAVEEEARRRGRWLLVLDTVPGENGHRLYQRAGWTQTGIMPDYAMFPDGRLCDTAIMWKRLDRRSAGAKHPGINDGSHRSRMTEAI